MELGFFGLTFLGTGVVGFLLEELVFFRWVYMDSGSCF